MARFNRLAHRHDNTLAAVDPVAAGIAAARAEQLAADPGGPAGLTLDQLYERLFDGC